MKKLVMSFLFAVMSACSGESCNGCGLLSHESDAGAGGHDASANDQDAGPADDLDGGK